MIHPKKKPISTALLFMVICNCTRIENLQMQAFFPNTEPQQIIFLRHDLLRSEIFEKQVSIKDSKINFRELNWV